MDDVRIWNVARSEAEIAAAMNGAPLSTVGLVACWAFNRDTVDAAGGRVGVLNGNVDLVGGTAQESGCSPTGTATPTPTLAGSATPTAGTTTGASATPTPVPTARAIQWGDSDCDGEISTRDNQALLREVLQQPPLSQQPGCAELGEALGENTWGNWDCDEGITTRDNQGLLRKVLSQGALSQTEPCPDFGFPVAIGGT